MKMMRGVLALLLCCSSFTALAAVSKTTLDAATMRRIAATTVGDRVDVALFPVAVGRFGPVSFERIDIYAPGAKVIEITPDGQRELPRSPRLHFIGTSVDGGARIALSIDRENAKMPTGAGFGSGGDFAVVAERAGSGWTFSGVDPASLLPAGVVPEYVANNDSLVGPNSGRSPLEGLQIAVQPEPSATTPARIAVVAVDTDASFLNKRFSDNTASATTFIADLFVQMNLIYRRDLDVVLQVGTTFLRVGSDPYPNADTVASGAQLTEFGNYWSANYTTGPNAVARSFAMLLSGNSAIPNSGSGIAWVDSYCQTGGNGGSYSTNQLFTNPAFPASSSTMLVAHELGHNFGAFHTHCSNNTTGVGPASTNTIDQCYSAESGQGCYGGSISCPAGGGTLMSYCHLGACPASTPNQLLFAPAHITRLRSRIAANTPSCLRNETILTTGFDS